MSVPHDARGSKTTVDVTCQASSYLSLAETVGSGLAPTEEIAKIEREIDERVAALYGL